MTLRQQFISQWWIDLADHRESVMFPAKALVPLLAGACLAALASGSAVGDQPPQRRQYTPPHALEAPGPRLERHFDKTGRLSHYRRSRHYLGYPGTPVYRPGYRRYNGWWYPPTAFLFGFNVVPPPSEIVRPPLDLAPVGAPAYGEPVAAAPGPDAAHVQWCKERYRSYRASDNSFQPYKGPRRACVSPHGTWK